MECTFTELKRVFELASKQKSLGLARLYVAIDQKDDNVGTIDIDLKR